MVMAGLLLHGGGDRDRTDGLLRARQALSQLSYTPVPRVGKVLSRSDGTPLAHWGALASLCDGSRD